MRGGRWRRTAEIERAVAQARRAQREWALTPLDERCSTMLRFLAAMEALNPEIVPELAWQMGRPVRYGGELRSLVGAGAGDGRSGAGGAGALRPPQPADRCIGRRPGWCW